MYRMEWKICMENLSVEKYAIFNFFSHYFHTSMEGTTEK